MIILLECKSREVNYATFREFLDFAKNEAINNRDTTRSNLVKFRKFFIQKKIFSARTKIDKLLTYYIQNEFTDNPKYLLDYLEKEMKHTSVASTLSSIEWRKWSQYNEANPQYDSDGFCFIKQKHLNEFTEDERHQSTNAKLV